MSWPPPLDHAHPDVLPDPYPVYRHYREHDPVHHVPPQPGVAGGRFILSRHADVVAALRDPKLIRNVRNSMWDETSRDIPKEHLAYARTFREFALYRDPPEHARLRQPINRMVNRTATASFREWVRIEAEDLAAALPDDGVVDMVNDYAAAITNRLVARLLGMTLELTMEEFDVALTCIQMVLSNRYEHARMTEGSAHIARLHEVLTTVIQRPVGERSEALLLQSILDEAGVSGLSEHQARSTAILLMMATRDNARSTTGSAVGCFLRYSGCWAALRAGTVPVSDAVDEVLRFEPSVQFVSRHAAEPWEIDGVRVPQSYGVTCALAAANRDPVAFEDPERFDIRRKAGRIASFGFGAHRCPGDTLARIMIEEALGALLRRYAVVELAVSRGDLRWHRSMVFRNLVELPVRVRARE